MNVVPTDRSPLAASPATKYRALTAVTAGFLLAVSPVSWNYYDVHLYMLTWSDGLSRGWNLYAVTNTNYPPLATYLFAGMETLARATAPNPLVAGTPLSPINWVRTVVRLPLVGAFLWTGRLLYRRWGWAVARYWLFTPPALLGTALFAVHPALSAVTVLSWTATIPLNVFYGYQFDLLAVPFTLLALFALSDGRPERFGLWIAVGALWKLYPVVLLPLGVARFGPRRQARAVGTFALVVGAVSAPFLLAAPEAYYYRLVGFQGSRFPQGLSPFHLPLLWLRYDVSRFPASLRWLWLVAWLPVYGVLVLAVQRRTGDRDLVLGFAAVVLSLVALNKVGNLNYLVWVWPFLLVALETGDVSPGYVTAIVLTTTLYPLAVYLPAAVAGEPIFVVQDLAWYDARTLLRRSFRGVAQRQLDLILRPSSPWAELAEAAYRERFAVLSAIVALHAAVVLLVLAQLGRALSAGRAAKAFLRELRRDPRRALRAQFGPPRRRDDRRP